MQKTSFLFPMLETVMLLERSTASFTGKSKSSKRSITKGSKIMIMSISPLFSSNPLKSCHMCTPTWIDTQRILCHVFCCGTNGRSYFTTCRIICFNCVKGEKILTDSLFEGCCKLIICRPLIASNIFRTTSSLHVTA